MAKKRPVHIGTSGWHYKHWKGPFYPEDMSTDEFLGHYVREFDTVEINNSFYRLPGKETFAGWSEAVPKGFVFAVKGSRYITHMKKLKDPIEPVAALMDAASGLGTKLGPVLFQLPPRWRVNTERLESFLRTLPEGHRFAFEFRDHSWYDDRVYDLLNRYGAAFCIYDLSGELSPKVVTADFVYVRLHGPDGAYRGSYGEGALGSWAGDIVEWSRSGREVFCYFDNDEAGYAAANAARLRDMVGGRKG